MKAMKHKDFKPCAICGQGMMHKGHILFLRVSIERHGILVANVKRADAMERLFQGNAYLANVMGPDDDLSQPIDGQSNLLVCGDCVEKHPVLYALLIRDDVSRDDPPTNPATYEAKGNSL